MVQNFRLAKASKAGRVTRVLKGAGVAVVAIACYTGSIVSAKSPDVSDTGFQPVVTASLLAPTITPSLSYSGTDVTLTGSVAHIFDGAAFAGANRAEKRDRYRTGDDVNEVTASFTQLRTHLASLRARETGATDRIEPVGVDMISVAGIDPMLISAALDAIDNVDTSKSGLPAPLLVPSSLAYARANTPATVFKTPVSKKVAQKQLWCLATAVYFEARGEGYRGQVGVAQVVMNRVNHKAYPSTICGVVFQNQSRRNACQFSFACDGIPERVADKKSWAQAEEIASKVTGGTLYLTEVANATHYHANYVYPRWAPRLKKVTKIGAHIFYRFKHG